MPRRAPTRTEALFAWIVAYKRVHDGNSPTVREIARGCGMTTTSLVNYHLRQLERQGCLRTENGQAGQRQTRNIVVIGGQWTYRRKRKNEGY